MNDLLNKYNNIFFIGIAGTGMSALAQYMKGIGKNVSGSDRYFQPGVFNDVKEKLEVEGIQCFMQNGEGISETTNLVVVSTAIEDTVIEVQKAKQLNIEIIKRSELLAMISRTKKTIAVAGTSGKSTTAAMLFDALSFAGYEPGIISGAGLVSLIKQNKIGNAAVGKGEWLIIEADESDGSIINYHPAVGLLLNIDKDHKSIDDLMKLFQQFKEQSEYFIVNQSNTYSKELSVNRQSDFVVNDKDAGYVAANFQQHEITISFTINDVPFQLTTPGEHNMQNALAASAVANHIGISLTTCAEALQHYEGIYRRHQVLGKKHGVWLIDDYAHNPAKCAASIKACQPIASKVIAWFQPHGYTPTKFLRNEFVDEISKALRPTDEIWMSEIFYAGGTAVKDISANDLINNLKAKDCNAFFVEDRNQFPSIVKKHLTDNSVLLLMGARDPSLSDYAAYVFAQL